jgi:hypothetical protein
MAINFIREHDLTKGPEAHQTYIFDIVADSPGPNHMFSVFEYAGEKYRAFRTYEQIKPVVKDGKKYPIHRVVAVKLADEQKWAKTGRQGKIAPGVLEGHVAR